MLLNIFFDGSPEKAVLYVVEDGQELNEGKRIEYVHGPLVSDSLQQEYFAFIKAIEYAPNESTVNFITDLQSIVAHMNSWNWLPPNLTIHNLHQTALKLIEAKKLQVRVLWCDRNFNKAG